VYLVRHKVTRVPKSKHSSPYILWSSENTRSRFEVYQSLQGKGKSKRKDVFGKRSILASFVVTPWEETLFVGLYRKLEKEKLPADLRECPVSGERVSDRTHHYYRLQLDERMSELRGKVAVDWGKSFRGWVQRADKQDKRVLELRGEIIERPFPGFRKFEWKIGAIEDIPKEWKTQLTQHKGIYLQQCTKCGRLYVGKADGEEGFMGRFREYAKSTDGGNMGMKAHSHKDYTVRILEVFPIRHLDDISKIESEWKKTLGTCEWGLNRNP